MVHYSKVINGIVDYIDHDMVQKMAGSWKAWGVGAAVALIARKAPEAFERLRSNPVIQMTGVVDGEMVDVDAIYTELLRQANRNNATIEIPFIGPVTYSSKDVDDLYRRIMI